MFKKWAGRRVARAEAKVRALMALGFNSLAHGGHVRAGVAEHVEHSFAIAKP